MSEISSTQDDKQGLTFRRGLPYLCTGFRRPQSNKWSTALFFGSTPGILKLSPLEDQPHHIESHTSSVFSFGNPSAYDASFREYFQPLCYYASKLLPVGLSATDIVQVCFIRLWEKKVCVQSTNSVRSFLYRTIHNACVDEIRAAKQRGSDLITNKFTEQELAPAVNEELLISTELIAHIYKSLETLPPRIRQVCQLYYLEGRKVQEISAMLKKSPTTIRLQRQRGIALLREKLQ